MEKNFTRIVVLFLMMLALPAACKRQEEGRSIRANPAKGKISVTNQNQSEPLGVPPYADPPTQTAPTAPVAEVDTAAEEMHESIVSELRLKHSKFENQTWFESRALIEGDWVAHSPKNYWKKDLLTLPAGYACKKDNPGCDPQFERKLCSSDMQCLSTHTQCVPLQASIKKVGATAKSMCLGSGDPLMDNYYFALTRAEKHLEISSLTLPSGRFKQVLINALSILSQRESPPTIRILLSSLDGISPNFINPPQKVLDGLLKDIASVGGQPERLMINLGFLSDKKLSWNHAKIVLADANHVLQGGHNFLDPDYLREQPIFDLSMHASGSLGIGVQNFVNTLWSKANPVASNLKDNARIAPPVQAETMRGSARVIGLGRMGMVGNNASDDGMSALLKASRKSIYFAQQDMFNDIVKLGPKPSRSLPELIDAILRGVTVRVAQSSSTVFLGYGMIAPEKALGLLLEAVTREANARKFVPEGGMSLREYLCHQIEYAPLLFNAALSKWPNGDAIGVHPKLIIADEVGFYMGSQNFYPSDLQEFGLLVSDTKITRQLLANYWNPIWEQSRQKKVECK